MRPPRARNFIRPPPFYTPPPPLEGYFQGRGGWACIKFGPVIPTKMFAVICKLFWEYLRCAVTIFGSETIISLCSCTCLLFSWDSFEYAVAAFKIIGVIFLCSCSSGDFRSELKNCRSFCGVGTPFSRREPPT